MPYGFPRPVEDDEMLLKRLGLTEGETRVYLALLSLGSSTTGAIVKNARVHTSKVYEILDRLIDKGIVSSIRQGKKQVFTANPPHSILSYLDSREDEIRDLKLSAQAFIGRIEEHARQYPTQATVFFGTKGLRTATEKMYAKMERGDTLYYLGIPAFQPESQHIYWQREHMRRSALGIKVKLLFNKGTDPEVLKNRNSYKGSQARYMPADIETPALFCVYKDVALIMLQSPDMVSVEIVNTHIARSFLAYFEEFWKRSERFDAKKP